MINRKTVEFLLEHSTANKVPVHNTPVVENDGTILDGSIGLKSVHGSLRLEDDVASMLTADESAFIVGDENHHDVADEVRRRILEKRRLRGIQGDILSQQPMVNYSLTHRDKTETLASLMTLFGTNTQGLYYQLFYETLVRHFPLLSGQALSDSSSFDENSIRTLDMSSTKLSTSVRSAGGVRGIGVGGGGGWGVTSSSSVLSNSISDPLTGTDTPYQFIYPSIHL